MPDRFSDLGVIGALGAFLLWFALFGLLLVQTSRAAAARHGGDGEAILLRRPRRRWKLAGNLLIAVGVSAILLAGAAYLLDPTQGGRVLPRPVAVSTEGETEVPESTPVSEAVPLLVPTATATATATAASTPLPTKTPAPTPSPTPAPAAERLVIPAIRVDSEVKDIGIAVVDGQPQWETVPFIVGHYKTTAQPGEKGNGVYSGHVTSRNLGNVFENLYQVNIGDEVQLVTKNRRYAYTVYKVFEVVPTEISVMDPTPDPTITLITCSGEWLADQHQYSHRLIVKAKLKSVNPR